MNADDPRRQVKEWLAAGDLKAVLVHSASLHGHYCPGLAFGVKAGHAGLRRLGFENTGMEELIAVVECNNCFADGVQMSTGCSFGNNALLYKDLGKTAVTILSRGTVLAKRRAVRVALRPNLWESGGASEREKEAQALFTRVVRERRNDPEARRRMGELFRELSFETIDKDESELFLVADVPAELPEYAPIFDSATCSVCGEEFMETRGALRNGQPVCLTCAKADCFAVLGRGVRVLPQGGW
jgi:formylmethanofuran dehydrogenase subunit E